MKPTFSIHTRLSVVHSGRILRQSSSVCPVVKQWGRPAKSLWRHLWSAGGFPSQTLLYVAARVGSLQTPGKSVVVCTVPFPAVRVQHGSRHGVMACGCGGLALAHLLTKLRTSWRPFISCSSLFRCVSLEIVFGALFTCYPRWCISLCISHPPSPSGPWALVNCLLSVLPLSWTHHKSRGLILFFHLR